MIKIVTSLASVIVVATSAIAEDGPVSVDGVVSSESFLFQTKFWPNPTVALLDATDIVAGRFDRFVPAKDQILGRFVDPLFTGNGQYRIELPIIPPGGRLDLNGDGSPALGAFAVVSAPNLSSNSYLEQLEQDAGLASILLDPTTGTVMIGTLLLFSEDDVESFPAGWGNDRIWFTEDDPPQVVPKGWSVARLDAEGRATIDTGPHQKVNTLEAAEEASLSLSDLGYVEAFDDLVDHLRVRYAYTEFRAIDWSLVSSTYRPAVVSAQVSGSAGDFFIALRDMALFFQDAHTSAFAGLLSEEINAATQEAEEAAFGAGIGAEALIVYDADAGILPGDLVVVSQVADGSPSAEAGWTEGTEILEVDRISVQQYLASLPLSRANGVLELQPYLRVPRLLRFPDGADVDFAFRNPGEQEIRTARLTAGDYILPFEPTAPVVSGLSVNFSSVGGVAIVSWNNFEDPILTKIAVLEEALQIGSETGSIGMILDLRGNYGGLFEVAQVMASYFFEEDKPMPVELFDWWEYDAKAGGFVRRLVTERTIHSPLPALAYTGPLAVLIDEDCASSCEYFTQYLQRLDRAVVVGQHASMGAGGFINRIAMPEDITFQYTAARTTFLDTSEPNIEASGIIPDIRVPVTLETLRAVRNGEDPVMDAAFDVITELSDPRRKLISTSWTWSLATTSNLDAIEIENPGKYTVTFGEDGSYSIEAGCDHNTGDWTLEDYQLTLTSGPGNLVLCPEPSRGEAFVRIMTKPNAISFDGNDLRILTEDDEYRVILLESAANSP